MNVQQEIKLFLVRNGIRQKVLAAKTGIPPQKISTSLNGKSNLTVNEFCKILDFLNVPAETFIKPYAGGTKT